MMAQSKTIMTQTPPKEEAKTGEVISMGEFLFRRKNRQTQECLEMYEKAKKLSKKEDPRADPFAAVLMKKVDALREQVDKTDKQLRFILRNGMGYVIPGNGYQTHYGTVAPPSVNISVGVPKHPL